MHVFINESGPPVLGGLEQWYVLGAIVTKDPAGLAEALEGMVSATSHSDLGAWEKIRTGEVVFGVLKHDTRMFFLRQMAAQDASFACGLLDSRDIPVRVVEEVLPSGKTPEGLFSPDVVRMQKVIDFSVKLANRLRDGDKCTISCGEYFSARDEKGVEDGIRAATKENVRFRQVKPRISRPIQFANLVAESRRLYQSRERGNKEYFNVIKGKTVEFKLEPVGV